MIAECYDLTVQCDDPHGLHAAMFVRATGKSWQALTRWQCWKQARKAGWLLLKDGGAVCPRCARDRKHTVFGT